MKRKLLSNGYAISIFNLFLMIGLSALSLFASFKLFRIIEVNLVDSLGSKVKSDFNFMHDFYFNELVSVSISMLIIMVFLVLIYLLTKVIIKKNCVIYKQMLKSLRIKLAIVFIIFTCIFMIATYKCVNKYWLSYFEERIEYFDYQISVFDENVKTIKYNPFASLYSFPDNYTLENLEVGKELCQRGPVIVYTFLVLILVENVLIISVNIVTLGKNAVDGPLDENGNVIELKKESSKPLIIVLVILIGGYIAFKVVNGLVDPFIISGRVDSPFSSRKFNTDDTCSDEVKILRAKEITDRVHFGDAKSEVEKDLGRMESSLILDYCYSLCGHHSSYLEDKYTFSVSSNKIYLISLEGLTTTPLNIANYLNSDLEDIHKEIKKVKRGMSFDKVKSILGNAYLLEGSSSYATKYIWVDTNGEYAIVSFKDGNADHIYTFNE